MAESHTVSGLKTRREEVAREVVRLDREREKLVADIAALDRALVLCGERRPTPVPLFPKGKFRRMLLDIKREKPDLKGNSAFAKEVIAVLEWNPHDPDLYLRIHRKVKQTFADIAHTKNRKSKQLEMNGG
jgi:hypothetical protein